MLDKCRQRLSDMQTLIHSGTFLLADVKKMSKDLGSADSSDLFPLEKIKGKFFTASYMCDKHKPNLPDRYQESVDTRKNRRQKLFNNRRMQRVWLDKIAEYWSKFESHMQKLESALHDQFSVAFAVAQYKCKDQMNKGECIQKLLEVCF